MTEPSRTDTITELALIVSGDDFGHPTRVAVDGTTASGKSTLAKELTNAVQALGKPTIHLTMDGYHNPRRHRYRRGKLSAEGYYEDAYDFRAFVDSVLCPLGPGGDCRYRERIIDLALDEPKDEPLNLAPVDAVVVVDGSFLQRPEIINHWDHCIFVNTSFEISLLRGITRDAALLGGEKQARAAYQARYHAAARLYIDAVHPADSATIVFDNDDLDRPRIRVQNASPDNPEI